MPDMRVEAGRYNSDHVIHGAEDSLFTTVQAVEPSNKDTKEGASSNKESWTPEEVWSNRVVVSPIATCNDSVSSL